MLRKIIFVQVLLSSVLSFLIQDFSNNVTSSPHGQTPGDTALRDLMNLIFEEKRIRYQLEDRLNAAENEINKMKQYDVAVSSEMEKESKELELLGTQNQILSDQLANMTAKNALLERKLDSVLGSLNDHVMNVTAKSMILESKLKDTLLNMTAAKLNLESKIDHLSGGFLNLSSETRRETAKISMNVHNMELQIENFSQNLHNISETFNTSTGVHVGFTVNNADANSGTNTPLKFQSTIFNSDASFSTSTGVFTCIYPGLYFFSATVKKTAIFHEYYCYFMVNNISLKSVSANGDSNHYSYPASSASIVLRLNKNDRVYLGSCSSGSYMYSPGVSFTGFRISP